MDYNELLQKYQALIAENNWLKMEINKLNKTQIFSLSSSINAWTIKGGQKQAN